MKVCGQLHEKEAYRAYDNFLPGCMCLCTLVAMFLLHSYLHSLNCVSFVISIFYLLHSMMPFYITFLR